MRCPCSSFIRSDSAVQPGPFESLDSLNLTDEILVFWILGVNRLHGLLEGSLVRLQDNRALRFKFVHRFLNKLMPDLLMLNHRLLGGLRNQLLITWRQPIPDLLAHD